MAPWFTCIHLFLSTRILYNGFKKDVKPHGNTYIAIVLYSDIGSLSSFIIILFLGRGAKALISASNSGAYHISMSWQWQSLPWMVFERCLACSRLQVLPVYIWMVSSLLSYSNLHVLLHSHHYAKQAFKTNWQILVIIIIVLFISRTAKLWDTKYV